MAKLKPIALGRPSLLDGVRSLQTVWLVALEKTKAGNTKPAIHVRVTEEADGWRGWAVQGRYRYQAHLWLKTVWRLATAQERKDLEQPDSGNGETAKPKRDTIPAPAPKTDAPVERGESMNGRGSHSPPVLPVGA